MSLEQLEKTFARAAKENADYLRECNEAGVLPNGVLAGASCWLARMAEAEILERKFKLPEFQSELEAEMAAIKVRLRQEKEQCRSQIHQLEHECEELKRLVGGRELPQDVLQAINHIARRQRALGLSESQLRERLNHLQELRILPEHRVQPDPDPEGESESAG